MHYAIHGFSLGIDNFADEVALLMELIELLLTALQTFATEAFDRSLISC